MKTESHYTFGDGDVAALRLRLLAEVYAPSSAALLGAAAPNEVALQTGAALEYAVGMGVSLLLLAYLVYALVRAERF